MMAAHTSQEGEKEDVRLVDSYSFGLRDHYGVPTVPRWISTVVEHAAPRSPSALRIARQSLAFELAA